MISSIIYINQMFDINNIQVPMSYYRRQYSPSPPKYYHPQYDIYDPSTADKIIDLEQSQKKYQELIQQNIWLKNQIDRRRHGQTIETHPIYIQNIQRGIPIGGDRSKSDMVLWDMIERNRYLQQKLQKLRRQQYKQANTIRKIQHSQQWQTRHVCVPSKCYHQKYMQLLRVRSPFF